MLMNRFVVFLVLATMLLYGKTIGKYKMCTSAVLDKGAQGQTKYEMKRTCCLNYHSVNGTCQECPPGTFGTGGKCDHPCPTGSFGKLCSQDCNCEDNERCDPAKGCICISEANCTGSSERPVVSLLQDTEHFNSSSILHDQFPILGISIVICCSVFSVTMLMITTSSLVLKWYLG